MNKKALIVIDIQYDICEGGPMANTNSLVIIPKINSVHDDYELVIFVKKTYNKDHILFKNHRGGIYPEHCIKGSYGSELHNDLIITASDLIINRCTDPNANSSSAFWDDENVCKETKLKYFLKVREINDLYFCGNNMDTCIFSTIMDAVNYNFKCYVIKDMIAFYDKIKCDECIEFLQTLNVKFI